MLSLGVDPVRAWVLARLGFSSATTAATGGARAVALPPVSVGADGSVLKVGDDNEVYVFRSSIIKKYVSGVLHLSVDAKREGRGIEQVLLALGSVASSVRSGRSPSARCRSGRSSAGCSVAPSGCRRRSSPVACCRSW